MTMLGIGYLFLLIAMFEIHVNIVEFWCLMVTGIPFINLFIQKVFNINN